MSLGLILRADAFHGHSPERLKPELIQLPAGPPPDLQQPHISRCTVLSGEPEPRSLLIVH